MFGLYIKFAGLLCVIVVVQGNVFLEGTYLQDEKHVGISRSRNYGSSFKIDSEAVKDFKLLNYLNRFYNENIKKWFSGSPNEVIVGPVKSIGVISPNSIPSQSNEPGTNHNKEECQNIQGIPKPESGCCGVPITRDPNKQEPPNYSKKTLWPWATWSERFRRSTDNDLPEKMIKGGEATGLYQLPWMVHIIVYPRVMGLRSPKSCGGTIISSRYVLTAAHCFDQLPTLNDLSELEVILAEYDTNIYPRDCIYRYGKEECLDNIAMKVDKLIIHEDYNTKLLQNDVALLKLSSGIPYTDSIRPICLPTENIENMQDEILVIAGWGLNGNRKTHLKEAAFVKYVENDKCKEKHPFKDDSLFCSIGEHGEDIGKGDSGGPLMAISNNKYFISGVVSGKLAGSGASLFNNVFYHKHWISEHAI